MYNPRNYAISVEKILRTPAHMTGEIEKNPLAFISSFLDAIYEKNEAKRKLIDVFDEKYAKYKDTHLLNWNEADASQMIKDLREIVVL